MKFIKTFAVAFAALTVAASAHASTVFSDNFDSDAQALNTTPTGWTVTNGTVDVVGPNFYGLCQPGQGNCVDLDGSTDQSGVLSKALNLTAGVTYTASYQLGGNQRLNQLDTITVNFGSSAATHTLGEYQAFGTYTSTFTPTHSGVYNLSFLDNSNNNVGAILDNVKVSAVPEPQTYVLMGLGVMLLAVTSLRRRNQA